MIRGHIDLSFITDTMLEEIVFKENNEVSGSNGFWELKNIPKPDYPADSPYVFQTFDEYAPQWVQQVRQQFPWLHHSMVTVNKILPGRFIPIHIDKFYRLRTTVTEREVNIEGMSPVRVNIFLQDKQEGHFLDVDNVALSSYKKGDWMYILPDQPHTVANMGYVDRYTMQVSGFALNEHIEQPPC